MVVALGAGTPGLARRFGHRFPLVPKRGYHRHMDAGEALRRPVVEVARGVVLAPMDEGLRITTGAALTAAPERAPRQIREGVALAETLLGRDLVPMSEVWTGVRPCMPDMLPVVGPSGRAPGLWFHFGHGHQGLTLAAETAARLARRIMDGGAGDGVDAALAPARFDR